MSISVILPKTGFQTAGTIINGIARTLDIPDYLALNHINTTRKIARMVICKMLQLTYGLQERAIGVLNSKMSIRAVARAFTTANRPHAQRFHVTAPTPSRRSLRTSKSVYSFHEFCLKLSQIGWWKPICTHVAFDVKWTSPLLDDDSGLKWINPWMSTHPSMSIVDTSVEGGCLPITNIPGICFQISWNRMLYYSTGQGGPLESHWRVPGLSGSLVFFIVQGAHKQTLHTVAHLQCLLVFTRGQFWPSHIVIACVCPSVRQSVRHQVCPLNNSIPVQARITKFRPYV